MTTSTSNVSADSPALADLAATETYEPPPPAPLADTPPAAAAPQRTVWSRFIVLMLCLAVVATTLAFGTVHSWSLAAFQASAAFVVLFWVLDAWRTGVLRVSRNVLQLPLAGLALIGLIQLLPFGGAASATDAALSVEPVRALSLDPYATRFVLIQLLSLLVYFAAALAFVDSPRRLRLVARLVIVFGFLLALYGLMQHFMSPAAIYWVRKPKYAEPFGPYINRHHFAGYMEMTLALPLGMLFAGAVARERILLYGFAAAMMCVALVLTSSRGAMIGMAAEFLFLVFFAATVRQRRHGEGEGAGRVRGAALRVAFGFGLVAAVMFAVLHFGGEASLSRLVGTVNSDDPTSGRMHFWSGTVEMIKDHPVLGVGLGAFAAAYTRYDTSSGAGRLEQAHNDYLQILSDAGVVGGLLGLVFLAALFRMGFARMQSRDRVRRGVALGSLAGCAGALVHSFFDFALHTTANALLFLVLAALATANGRVEEEEVPRHRRRRRRRGADSQRGGEAVGGAYEKERAAA